MRMYIYFLSEFMSNKYTHVYVKYPIISNRFLKRIVCVSETSRIFILNMPSRHFNLIIYSRYNDAGLVY